MLPGCGERWTEVMAAILKACGGGAFEYGWEMNLEPPRENELATIEGVAVDDVTPMVVQAIDFTQWDSWDSFMRGIRKGARQSAQFARRDIPDLRLETFRGLSAVAAIPDLVRLRLNLSSRKGLRLRALDLVTSYLGWMLLCRNQTVARLAHGRGRVLAAYLGLEFSINTYYQEAASVPDNGGASWALLLYCIKDAYDRSPGGRFVMGYVNYALYKEEVGGGLVQSRHAVRAVDFPTSVVRFRYIP